MVTDGTNPGAPGESVAVGRPPRGTTAAVTTMMRRGAVPGLSMVVVTRDRVLFAAGYGLADRAAKTPATASTSYLWFSMSKIVTATAACRLVGEGRLDLNAPADEYVDYLRAPGAATPNVGQLLNHTAGLGNPMPIRWVHPADADPPDPVALLRRLMGRRRAYRYPAGRSARYSNVGYLAAGEVIAAASGMPFEAYVRQSVLRPVGMDHTGFRYPDGAARATGYVKAPRIADPLLRGLLPGGIAGSRHGPYLSLNPFYVDGPAYGGLVGDVLDAGRFLRLHLRDGEIDGTRVLSPGAARSMRTIDEAGKPFHHGTGWFRRPTKTPGQWVEHFGAGAGFWNVMRLFPDLGLGIVVMSNSTRMYDFEPLFALLASAPWP
ncbi:CubicO group peptidase (beta-lactamase class C family) [Pseudarthrobacter oxydans]|uniref:serine hydrolase domain-containing protein n=1 Tax=Pseudarthrobacter oxydans TaxID=1671 RepID=UPI002782F023|nr:serine hydrolase domain-containing protein [Pseudarthrobacter oxydans]MDP9983798.1 CubicO group peptidase (beta-lactamase class C family) [Pseudarthrobacter oxydans]